jgi:hypothetical protein
MFISLALPWEVALIITSTSNDYALFVITFEVCRGRGLTI